MKKQLSFILFVVAALTANAFEVRTPSGDTIQCYTVSGTTNEVTVEKAYGKQYIGHLTIPNTVQNNGVTYNVTRISSSGFANCTLITSITLPSSLTHIGDNAFSGCSGLTSISLVAPLQSIGGNAFKNCTGLTQVTIPTTVNNLGGYSFQGCANLTTVNLNADSLYLGYWTWGNYPFDSNYVTTVHIGSNVKRLPNYIFCGCSHLTTLTLGNSLRRIDNGAFFGCRGLTSVTIPNATTYIGSKAFYQCTNLSQVTLGNSVDTILEYAFYQCNISSMTIPQTMKYIGSYAFQKNQNFTSLTFNADSCRFSSNALTFDTNLTSVTIGPSVRYIPQYFVYNNRHISSVVLPDAVRRVGGSAFYGCSGLNTLTVGRGLQYVELYGFSNCTTLTVLHYNADSLSDNSNFFGNKIVTLTLGGNVRYIPNGLFSNCKSLSGMLVLPSSVTRVGNQAFYNCDGITSITIPPSVQSIGTNAFRGCDSLTAVFFNASNCTSQSSSDSPFGSVYGDSPKLFSVTFGGAVAKVPDNLFRGCSYLNSITFGGGTTEIGNYAFASCNRLKNINLPYPISVVGTNAFAYLDSVTTLTLPSSLDSIANGAFYGMSRLQRVDYTGTIEQWCGIKFVDNPVYYSRCLYIGGHRLVHLNLLGIATKVSAKAFQRCSSLRSISTGHACSLIEANAFDNCDSLLTVVFGSGLDSIGYCAFSNCNRIDSVACRSNVPPALNNNAMSNFGNRVPLHVPCGAAAAYSASAWHNRFNNIVEDNSHMINAIPDNYSHGSAEVTQPPTCYNNTAVITATPLSGYRFDHWQDGNNDNPRTVTVTSDVTYTAYFVSLTGIESEANVMSPNVVSNGLTLTVSGLDGGEVSVVDLFGRTVHSAVNTGSMLTVELPAAGVYIVRTACCGSARIIAVR